MRYEILVAPDAGNQLAALPTHTRSEVRDGIVLRFEPTKLSESRIKRLQGLGQPHYRPRVGEIRVFMAGLLVSLLGLAPRKTGSTTA